ncbi:MAG: hypothetical protein M3Q58_02100 [Bacteroidota bacterium]|nr:hypothetical protein [Bacteroidota bacterium]
MIYSRNYNFNSIPKELINSIDIFIIGSSSEPRACRISDFITDSFQGDTFLINYDIEFEKYSINHLINKNEKIKPAEFNLLESFILDLKKIQLDGKKILIDSTSLKHPLLLYMIRILKENFNLANLFIGYTEPEKYEQVKNFKEQKFDLTEKFCSTNSIPGLVRSSDYLKEKVLVVLMGFEGNRFRKAFEEVSPSKRKVHAIVGFPSFHPNWQYYVYSQNQSALVDSKAYTKLHRATANEPFSVYNILNEISNTYPDHQIVVAPVGTKPHSIGAGMFLVDNPEVQVFYDFPSYGEKVRTIGIGDSYLYNLTAFLNEK